MIFYDFESFTHDWMVVIINITREYEHETVIVNDCQQLQEFFREHKYEIWAGYNSRHYDQYILKGIVSGVCNTPEKIHELNNWIIVEKREAWAYSPLLREVQVNNYDVMPNPPVGLKTLEGFMGSNIKETAVPFNIDRKLTEEEIQQTIFYCRHDVEETINVFLERKAEFEAQFGIVQAFNLDLKHVGDTEARITAKVLDCKKRDYGDEFDYFFLPCIQLKKYAYVMDWFRTAVEDCTEEMKRIAADPETKPKDKWKGRWRDEACWRKYFYDRSLENQIVAGIPHTFGWGGIHGAIDHPVHVDGYLLHVDVGSYYPSMLIAHGLVTRAAANDNYKRVYDTRMALKAAGKKAEQAPYKKLLNALSGAMKDKTNPAYDARNNNTMCINGQLMLLDLIEHLEVVPGFQLIQSNTDGLIISIPDTDEAFFAVDDICYEWESRCSTDLCSIKLGLDVVKEIYQKDVNNYLWVDLDGGIERKGSYVKELSSIDYDLPILNKALVEYMVHKTPVEQTINECQDLIEFQKIAKLSDLFEWVEHEYGNSHEEPKFNKAGKRNGKMLVYDDTRKYTNKSYRVFASKDPKAGRLLTCRVKDGRTERKKFGNTPDKCFIFNESVVGVKCPPELDREWYISEAKKRLKHFGLGG